MSCGEGLEEAGDTGPNEGVPGHRNSFPQQQVSPSEESEPHNQEMTASISKAW